jgi:glycosyltransferase involved in cell wall biosynthesis
LATESKTYIDKSSTDRAESAAIVIACHAHAAEQIGGAFKLATELAEYLARQGHRVCYVCGTNESAPVNPTKIRGVELWRYHAPAAGASRARNLIRHVQGAYRLTVEILRRSPVVCLNGHSPLQFLGSSLAIGKNARQVYSVHSPFPDEIASNQGGSRRSIKQRAMVRAARMIERSNVRRADRVQGDSRFTAARLVELYGQGRERKIVVAPGWVDVERFQPAADVPAIRAALGPVWRTAAPVFFTVRRLEARMGLEQLIEAAQMLREQNQEFRLIIGGAGVLAEKLQRLVHDYRLEDRVHLVGRISDDELPRCFAAADCFVLPTRALECFGLIVLEAYACGTPVIGTPVGAIPELVAEHGSQWLTAGTSAEEIAERMAAFLRGDLAADRAKLQSLAERWRAERGLENLERLLLPQPVEKGDRHVATIQMSGRNPAVAPSQSPFSTGSQTAEFP